MRKAVLENLTELADEEGNKKQKQAAYLLPLSTHRCPHLSPLTGLESWCTTSASASLPTIHFTVDQSAGPGKRHHLQRDPQYAGSLPKPGSCKPRREAYASAQRQGDIRVEGTCTTCLIRHFAAFVGVSGILGECGIE